MNLQTAAAAMAALVLAGCGGVRYPSSYLLNLPAAVPRAAAPQAPFGPVAVREFRCADYLCEVRIVYRPTREEVGFYEHHRVGSESAAGDHAVNGGHSAGAFVISERRRSRTWY